ncbi:hypothetical protein nbrc107696_46270 [Gordonia spumicola]|uniref:Uncharacterized protein n=1 Tax=Gordonia spumicola TaxID=589161 RepID=A0A7I9VGF1_9ACTN|nr:hypothetical protein nbrc107696_46270 [Gordonia spumicola]
MWTEVVVLTRMTQRIIAAPKLVLDIGRGGPGTLRRLRPRCGRQMLAGGYEDPGAESSTARDVAADEFAQGGMQFVIKLDARPGTDATTEPAGDRRPRRDPGDPRREGHGATGAMSSSRS